jgi:hypothetical protein
MGHHRYNFNIQAFYTNSGLVKITWRNAWILFFHRHPWLLSKTSQGIMFVLIFCLPLFLGLMIEFVDRVPGFYPCYKHASFATIMTLGAVAAALVFVYTALLWDIQDSYMIRYECIALILTLIPCLIVWALAYALRWPGVPFHFFWVSLAELCSILCTIVMPLAGSYRYQAWYRRDLRDLETSSTISIDDEFRFVLNDPTLHESFRKYENENTSTFYSSFLRPNSSLLPPCLHF